MEECSTDERRGWKAELTYRWPVIHTETSGHNRKRCVADDRQLSASDVDETIRFSTQSPALRNPKPNF